ncbi:ly6/PLAUR domain-containing protein 6B [Callorhinchus milii]|uniref:LY6/PLAUR domain containing 6B n=1 Tax=Callorhinchus milii TaxID=7868 RepID=V9LE91_CALMI|nr:ly6/PLAUR domain-containing protein 6B [Callorhinchus milii]XP_007894535.1 ly6/PLAUR domain-containing protein 6B [Callorhinchus milii]|eukprot:gi/632957537/ref/XP_007894534.1/ PREDICTED: ly6/PLAUR domain-containing protein 6B [Callorhinchus milii]
MHLLHQPTRGVLFQLLLVLADGVFTRNVNFHNVKPPMSPTPFPNSFKCFTCDGAPDNYNCNRWAEDRWCPQHAEYCLTIYRFTGHGRSKSVTKRCVSREECHLVGCRHVREFGFTECVSCCEGMICNVDVPTNHTNAVFAAKRPHRFSSAADGRKTSLAETLATVVLLSQLL